MNIKTRKTSAIQYKTFINMQEKRCPGNIKQELYYKEVKTS